MIYEQLNYIASNNSVIIDSPRLWVSANKQLGYTIGQNDKRSVLRQIMC